MYLKRFAIHPPVETGGLLAKNVIKVFGAKKEIKDVEKLLTKVLDYSKKKDIVIQVFNADMIYGKLHLIQASEHALRAYEKKTMSSNSLSMEILLYASAERQLKKAIPKMGVKKGKTKIAFVLLSKEEKDFDFLIKNILETFSLNRDDNVLDGDISVLKRFGLSDLEIETVSKDKYQDLILEKVAMVDIIK